MARFKYEQQRTLVLSGRINWWWNNEATVEEKQITYQYTIIKNEDTDKEYFTLNNGWLPVTQRSIETQVSRILRLFRHAGDGSDRRTLESVTAWLII